LLDEAASAPAGPSTSDEQERFGTLLTDQYLKIPEVKDYRNIDAVREALNALQMQFPIWCKQPADVRAAQIGEIRQRTAAYEAAFQRLKQDGAVYPCSCTRKEIADSALQRGDELVYPGTCRNGIAQGKAARAWRVRVNDATINFSDGLQGNISQDLASEVGDFVVLRADGLFAYQLAVVVDDAAQGITDVVRGADLLYSTPRQIYLQGLLGLAIPTYMHLPVAVNAQGEKLSKQTLAQPVAKNNAVFTLFDALVFLRQQPPVELRLGTIEQILAWAVSNWQPQRLSNCLHLFA